jgi:hypothetical protein
MANSDSVVAAALKQDTYDDALVRRVRGVLKDRTSSRATINEGEKADLPIDSIRAGTDWLVDGHDGDTCSGALNGDS